MTSQTLIFNDHNLSISISKSSLSSTQVLLVLIPSHCMFFSSFRQLKLFIVQILTVALLNELAKGKRSMYYPYLTQFPSSYDILASFDQFEIQALQVRDYICFLNMKYVVLKILN